MHSAASGANTEIVCYVTLILFASASTTAIFANIRKNRVNIYAVILFSD
jgi:hypothetical protein